MIVEYYELSALVGVGKPGRPVTLNDIHKQAWALYTGTGNRSVPRGSERPFIFRADPYGVGRYLFTLRSAQHFAKADGQQVAINKGDSLLIELPLLPFRYEKREMPNGGVRGVQVAADISDWPGLIKAGLERRGYAVTHLDVDHVGKVRIRHRDPWMPQAMVTAQVTVDDPVQVADGWLAGVAPKKAYGMGMPSLMPESPVQPQRLRVA